MSPWIEAFLAQLVVSIGLQGALLAVGLDEPWAALAVFPLVVVIGRMVRESAERRDARP